MAITLKQIMADPTLLTHMREERDGKDGDPLVESAEWHPDERWPFVIDGKNVSEAKYYEGLGALVEDHPPVGRVRGGRVCGDIF